MQRKVPIEPFHLERFFAEHEFTAPHLMCVSDCEAMSLGELLDLEPDSREEFDQLWLGYIESKGTLSLRQEITKLYERMSVDQVLVHHGAEEAIFNFMHAVLAPGDEIVVHSPCYQSLYSVAESLGVKVKKWEVRQENRWKLDLDFLKKSITKDTRAVVINTPHNPTGFHLNSSEQGELVSICRKHGVYLFSDEVYRFSEYSREDLLSGACDLYEKGVSLGVMSKSFGLAGLRIGWIATQDRELYEKMAGLKDYTTICNSAPGEFLAELALRNRQTILERITGLLRKNLSHLEELMHDHAERLDWVEPLAGPLCFPRYLGSDGIDEFCERVRKESGVLLLPASQYGFSGKHFRVGFGRKNFPEVLDRFRLYLDEHE